MSNETYRLCQQAIQEARDGVRSRCLYFIRPSNLGKSDTAKIISRDLKAYIIPVMSISEQVGWFKERADNPIFIFDDPSDWYLYIDRYHLFSILKNLLTGWLVSGRATKFDFNVPNSLEKKAVVIMFSNEEQHNLIRKDIVVTGLDARCEKYFTKHSEETKSKISKCYAKHRYGGLNLPRFRNLNHSGFFDDKFLNSYKNKMYFIEDIDFDENEEIELDGEMND